MIAPRASLTDLPSPTGNLLRALVTLGLAVALVLTSAGVGFAQAIDESLWVTNGQVNAIVRDGGTIYIGGSFTRVGRATGGGAPIDVASGTPIPSLPRVDGSVYAVASDGAGGWYIGGSFTAVGGLPRANIAHVASDMSVTAWNPDADFHVQALAVSGTIVYAGGDFTSIGGQARSNIAALDATTGAATASNPNANNTVWALAVSGTTVYAGGYFTSIGGQERNRIAALDAATGAATTWNPDANSVVLALAVSDTAVYAGGFFTSIGGQARSRIAALDTATGAAIAWNPAADNGVYALALTGATVYAGGDFTSVGGQARNRIAALDVVTGAATASNPDADGTVAALAASGATVYAGGGFSTIGGQARSNIGALDAATGAATAWNPNPSSTVRALAVSGSTLYAGGFFTSVGGQARNRIAALDAGTGAPTAWNPDANNVVLALAVRESTVYAAGYFTSIGGQARNRIAALDAATGAATAWNPDADYGGVHALVVSGSTVYAGGDFTNVGGQARNRIAALDAATGAATVWNPDANSVVLALALSGSTVYAGGQFTSIGGQARNYVAALDGANGLATTWNPNADSTALVLAVSDSTVYVGGYFNSIGGQARNYVGALDATNGMATAWNPNANGNVHALAASGATVYAGGAFTSIGGQTRNYIAALDVGTGAAAAWNPNANPLVLALLVSGSTVYAGGFFDYIGLPQSGVAAIAAAPVLAAVQPASGGEDGVVTVTVSGSHMRNGATVKLSRTAQPDIPGDGVLVAAGGDSLTATFDLRGAALGLWDLVVVNPDLQTATLSNGFTIELSAPRLMRVDVLGPARMRPNRRKPFDIVIQNLGNNDVLAVPVWIHRIPDSATVALGFPLAPAPQDGGEPDWSQVPLIFSGPGGRYLPMVIPRIPPGVTVRRVYLTVPNSVTSFELDAAFTPPWEDGSVFRSCLAGAGVIQNPACMGSQLTAINAYLAGAFGMKAMSGIGLWSKIAWQCEGAASLPQALAKAEQVLDYMLQPLEGSAVPSTCEQVLPARWQDALAVEIVSSVDPNDKLGIGLGMNQEISPQNYLTYSVRFENVETAPVPAQDVVVTDQLDPTTMALGSVSLGPITFGNRTVELTGRTRYDEDVDLRPQTNLIVRVSAHYDSTTGFMEWTLESIDPDHPGEPPDDSLGVLPPNNAQGRGEGSAFITVRPRSGLAPGTAITNRATITFDTNQPIQTPPWSNTLDITPPQSQVRPLAANADPAGLTVEWEAVGSTAGLQDFSVYVAEDGGTYRPWREHITATADTFMGHRGHVYSFYSLACDSSGNLEAVPTNPDAATMPGAGVGDGGGLMLALEGAHPNPATREISVWFTLPNREPATLEVMDIAGRRLLRRDVGALGPGRHNLDVARWVRFRPGLYFLRLAQGGRVVRARVAVVR